jgi:glutamyl/glutaminyl-tRNA synthetase
MLGHLDRPRFAHHPVILKSSGEKLSKSGADTGVRELRRAGVSAEEVIGRAAATVGLIDQVKSVAARDVAGLFKTLTSEARHLTPDT